MFLRYFRVIQAITTAVTVATTGSRHALAPNRSDDVPDKDHRFLAAFEVTAAGGTSPTVDASVETSWDGTNWFTVASMTQLVGAGSRKQVVALDYLGPFVRSKITPGGTAAPNTVGQVTITSASLFTATVSS
jgi:hypothetical protein